MVYIWFILGGRFWLVQGERATDRQTDRQSDRQTDRQTEGQTDAQTHLQILQVSYCILLHCSCSFETNKNLISYKYRVM